MDLPDLLADLQNRTGLTRRGICRILIDSGRLDNFLVNPAKFIETATVRAGVRFVDGLPPARGGTEREARKEAA